MRYIIGMDEVGRGALAGPVVVAAVAAPADGRWLTANSKRRMASSGPEGKLRDSKKLTARRRDSWFDYIVQHPALCCSIARVYPRQIEKRNIARAANLAAERAYARLTANGKRRMAKHKIFLDGGLHIGNGERPKNARTIVRGDEKIKAIAASSIIAKVHRDRLMVRLAKKYPQYGFEVHKGYGTKKHMAAIKKCGPSDVHRWTFLSGCDKVKSV